MRTIAIIALAIVAVSAVTDLESWVEFKKNYGRNYDSNGEEAARYAIFVSNLRKAEQLNSQDTATYGVTKFMDLTTEEFLATYAGLNTTLYNAWIDSLPAYTDAPVNNLGTDWKAKGLVARVKDQGQCGSCWAFGATGAAEGCYAVTYGKTIDLSSQQIVDCCSAGGSDGCNGGWHDSALQWAMERNIATWNSYTYTGKKGTCKAVTTVGLKAHTCTYHSAKGESAMISALTHSTVAVALDATPFQTFISGVISGTTCKIYTTMNHAVLLVADETYLTIKNSWGTSWGEAGYVRLQKGVNCLQVGTRTAVAY
jgi:hypothetical protein